jgi:NTE family protein
MANRWYLVGVWVLVSLVISACSTVPKQAEQTPPPTVSVPEAPKPATNASIAPISPPKELQAPRLGLALGGGAARGFAHVGVLQVLEENGFHPQMIAGTSAGSLVAALYAAGNNGAALERIAKEMDESAITDWTFPSRGVIKGEALALYVRQQTAGKTIEQMALPLGIVATDLGTGEAVLFRRGDTGTAVRASSAVPSIFQPVKIGTHEYVDGGLASPVPVRFAREMGAEVVLAVDISSAPTGNSPQEAFGMLLQTFAIMGRSINNWELKAAELVVRPELSGVKGSDFSAKQKAIAAGRAAMLAALPKLKLLMQPK